VRWPLAGCSMHSESESAWRSSGRRGSASISPQAWWEKGGNALSFGVSYSLPSMLRGQLLLDGHGKEGTIEMGAARDCPGHFCPSWARPGKIP
jgi:hypothetical protein